MKSVKIEGQLREKRGSTDANRLRRQEMVPGVIYGTGKNIHFYSPRKHFKDAIYTAETMLVEITLDGEKHTCVLRDTQFHPVSDELEHVDLYQFDPSEPITIMIPVRFRGTPKGVRNGGRLKVNLRSLPVKATVDKMPGMLEINVEHLKIGDALRIEDLDTEGLEVQREPTRTLLTIQTARNAVVEDEDEDDEEGEEGEGSEETAEAENADS